MFILYYSSINSEYSSICMLDTVKEQKRTHRIKYFGFVFGLCCLFQAFENQNFTDDVML